MYGPYNTAVEACNGYNGENSIGYKDNEEGKFYGLRVSDYVFTTPIGTEFPVCGGNSGNEFDPPDSIPVIRQTKVTFIYLDSEGEDKCGKASKGTKTDSTKTSKTTKAPKRIR